MHEFHFTVDVNHRFPDGTPDGVSVGDLINQFATQIGAQMGQVFDELKGKVDAASKSADDAIARVQATLDGEQTAIADRDKQIADLKAQLAAAPAGGLSPAEVTTLETSLSDLQTKQDAFDQVAAAVPPVPTAPARSAPNVP